MAAVRAARVTWTGDLEGGSGVATAESSGAFRELPVSWASRIERPDGRTSPEELVAAAHASCFSMALAGALAKRGAPPERLDVVARVTFEQAGGGYRVRSSALEVRGRVPGLDRAAFEEAAQAAKDGCPVSRALEGNVELSVRAELEAEDRPAPSAG